MIFFIFYLFVSDFSVSDCDGCFKIEDNYNLELQTMFSSEPTATLYAMVF